MAQKCSVVHAGVSQFEYILFLIISTVQQLQNKASAMRIQQPNENHTVHKTAQRCGMLIYQSRTTEREIDAQLYYTEEGARSVLIYNQCIQGLVNTYPITDPPCHNSFTLRNLYQFTETSSLNSFTLRLVILFFFLIVAFKRGHNFAWKL